MRDRKEMDLDGRGGGEVTEGVGGGIIRIYYMREKSIFSYRKNKEFMCLEAAFHSTLQ